MRPFSTRADRALRCALLGLAAALLALLPASAPALAATTPPDDAFAHAMLRELNRVRAAQHLPAVREDAQMDRGAGAHSRDMAQHGYFAHGSWAGRVMAAAGSTHAIGEVIGSRRQASPRAEAAAMVREWLASPPHRRVLLDGDFGRVGIGRASAAQNGRPAALYTVDWASTG